MTGAAVRDSKAKKKGSGKGRLVGSGYKDHNGNFVKGGGKSGDHSKGDKFTGECRHCGMVGHKALECWHKDIPRDAQEGEGSREGGG